jgi:hypothetical protein
METLKDFFPNFADLKATPPSDSELESAWKKFPPLGRTSATHRYVNFDGFVVLSNGDPHSPKHHSYAQVFRNGVIEAALLAQSPEYVTWRDYWLWEGWTAQPPLVLR